MNDVRLIDANVLPNYKCQVTATVGDQKGPAEMRFVFWKDIEKAPTIDAVPVVRCRDCIHRGWELECPMCFDEWDENGIHTVDHTTDDGFCHNGKEA